MKKGINILKRFLSGFLSLVIVFSIIPYTSLTSIAADNQNLPVLEKIDEYNAKTSTAIKNLSTMMNASSNSAKYAALLKRAGGYATLIGGSIDAINGAINSFDRNDSLYENILNIGSGAVAGFLGLSSSNTSAPSIQYDFDEIKSMIQDMDKDLQEIESQLDNLEATIEENFEELTKKIEKIEEKNEQENDLVHFTKVFAYYKFKSQLYKLYKNLLATYNPEYGEYTEEKTKLAYDQLYICALKSRNIEGEDLYGYITGDDVPFTGDTIQDVLFDYLKDNDNFELTCIEFAADLHSTYIFAQYCLLLCYNYQLLYAREHGQPYNDYYLVFDIKDKNSVQYASISTDIENMLNDQNSVSKIIAKYMCKVLRLNGEFNYVSRGIRFGTIPYAEISTSNIYGSVAHQSADGSTVYYRTNNNIQKGDVIQICEMPDEYMSMFSPNGFSISVSNSNATVLPGGMVQVVGSSGSFDVIYSYDDAECYRSTFNILSKYSGGMGLENAPYLISTQSEFNAIRCAEKLCNYLLINDINCNGAQLPIINISTGGFGGILDGGGYKVYNYQITSYGINNNQFNNSLFPIIKRGAIIKNLTIGDLNCKTYNGYSVQHKYSFGPSGYSFKVYNGVFSGINEGTISNCSIQNVKINAQIEMQPSYNSCSLDAYVGGFAACNRGTIAHSEITNCNFTGRYTSNIGYCKLFIGGISGTNSNLIANCFSLDNSIVAETRAESKVNYISTQSLIYGGNIIGQNSGSVSMIFGENCSIIMNPYGTHERRAIYGVQTLSMPSIGSAAVIESQGLINRGDGKAILDHKLMKLMCDFIPPHKTIYYIGEALNLTGLELYYTNTIRQDLLGISNKVRAYGFEVFGFDSNKVGTQTVTLTYNDISTSFEVTILCQHQWDNGTETSKPSHTEYGVYTEICSICSETKEYSIDKLPDHEFSSWEYYDKDEHQKTCLCGEKEYKHHAWNNGVITTPATPGQDGVKTFTCWDCKATYTSAISAYSITFNTNGGTHIETIFETAGTTITAPATPTKEGYTFAGWDKEIPATMPAENVTITALWTPNTYTVTWIVDGNEYKKTDVTYGNAIIFPEAPVKAQSGCIAYTFAGWSGYTDGMTMPAANQTFTAEFTESASHTSDKFTYVNNTNGTHTKKHECCGVVVNATEACADVAGDQNHVCDFCGAADVSAHNGGTATCKTLAACAECGQSYGLIDPTKHESIEITYTDIQKTTHDEYFACCNALKLDNTAHIYADHLCACGAGEYLIVTFMNGDAQYFKSETKYNTALDISYLAAPEASKGYAFVGWYTESGTRIENGMTITESMVVYAKFVAGDADGNGKIEKKDANNILKYIVGQNVPVNDATALDVNRDGKVTVVDVVTLLLYLAGKIELIN